MLSMVALCPSLVLLYFGSRQLADAVSNKATVVVSSSSSARWRIQYSSFNNNPDAVETADRVTSVSRRRTASYPFRRRLLSSWSADLGLSSSRGGRCRSTTIITFNCAGGVGGGVTVYDPPDRRLADGPTRSSSSWQWS
jgi:hypothetical protein